NPSMPVIPDLGIYGSSDPVAIDRACIDAETNAPGLPILNKDGEWTTPLEPGVEKFKAMIPYLDPLWVFEAAVRNNLGNISYKLIKI
ncbi:MAG: hypothetical protein Lokiarch_53320, partial [Candidatus Lokiarchaeum sp. GC14_75]